MATLVEIDDDDGVDWAEVKRPYPHFFKVLVGDYFTHRMKIPPNFIKNLEEDMTSKASSSSMRQSITASIEGPSGRTWYVELEKTASGVFFTTGWSNFARDHSLKERELLIFRYNGYMSFTVLIFDKTSCEKNLDSTGSGCERRTVRLKPRKLAFDEDELGDQLNAKEKSVPSTERNVTEVETEEEEEEEENAVEPSFHKRKKALEKRKRAHWRLSNIPPVTEKKLKVQEDADSFVSENPFFVICLNASDVNRRSMPLRLPVAFSRKYMPRRKTDLILRVSANCKTWPVVFQPYEDERDRLSRGWTSFASDNSLKECDCCAFELVKPAEFLVHIFRVSKVQLPSASRATMKTKGYADESVPSTEPKITETDTEDEEMNPVQNSSRKQKKASERSKNSHRCSSRLHPVTEKEKQATQEAAHSFASENPFFVICLNTSAVYGRSLQLKLPVELSKRHLPRRKTNVILHVSTNSKTWSVGFLPYVAQKDRLSRGWSSFVSDNSLEEYDYCAFELVKSAEFLVHIFRVPEV